LARPGSAMRRQLLQGSAMRRQLLQLCLPWPRLPRHGCFLSVSWASNQPRECRGPRDEISVQSANYLPDIRLLSTANPFKSLLLLQKCVLKGLRKVILERARALKKRLFWKSLTRYGSRGVATGVSDAPPAAFSTHGLRAVGVNPRFSLRYAMRLVVLVPLHQTAMYETCNEKRCGHSSAGHVIG
jgi:hypothetical protein